MKEGKRTVWEKLFFPPCFGSLRCDPKFTSSCPPDITLACARSLGEGIFEGLWKKARAKADKKSLG